jgi:DNA-binding response OmpR family regulator
MNGSAALECADPKSVGSTIGTGKLEVDLDRRLVTVDGNPVNLTQREYEILELLGLRKGTIVTKEMFLNHLYGGRNEPEIKIIDVLVCNLRKRLARATGGHNYIETVWGRGYVLRDAGIQPMANAAQIGRRAGNAAGRRGPPRRRAKPEPAAPSRSRRDR